MRENLHENRANPLIVVLLCINILLMISIAGLFIKVDQLQQRIFSMFQPIDASIKPDGLEIGVAAPTFSLQGIDGQNISNHDFLGKEILLIFFSPKCTKCIEMLPAIKEASKNHNNMQILMISNGDIEANRQLVETESLSFPVLVWDDTVAMQYKVSATPFYYVIDVDGKVSNYGLGDSLKELVNLAESNK